MNAHKCRINSCNQLDGEPRRVCVCVCYVFVCTPCAHTHTNTAHTADCIANVRETITRCAQARARATEMCVCAVHTSDCRQVYYCGAMCGIQPRAPARFNAEQIHFRIIVMGAAQIRRRR